MKASIVPLIGIIFFHLKIRFYSSYIAECLFLILLENIWCLFIASHVRQEITDMLAFLIKTHFE